MRTVRGLYPQLCREEHLERSALLTFRGKRRRPDVAWFLFTFEEQIAYLHEQLTAGTWRPSGFEYLAIRDPKPRLIARAPLRDRVMHTAVVELLEPVFAPSYTPDDFACRPGYGTHRALLRLLESMRRYRYALHLDVRSYFPSIDRELLLELVARRIRDPSFVHLAGLLLKAGGHLYASPAARKRAGLDADWPPPGRGLPIGAHLSQTLAAHVYLNAFDHWVKRTLKVPAYLRFVDDLFLFADRRRQLETWREEVARWLFAERGLRLKRPRAGVLPCHGHLDALGHRIKRGGITCRPRLLRRFQRRLAAWLDGWEGVDIERSIASSVGASLLNM